MLINILKHRLMEENKGNGGEGGGGGGGGGSEAESVGSPVDATGKAATPTPAPELEDVTVNGQTFKVDKGIAQALNGFMDGVRSEISSLKAAGAPAPTPAPVVKDDEYDYATGLFTEPEKAIERLRASIKAEIQGEQKAAENVTLFWKGFYENHKDMKGLETLVDAVMQKNYASLKDRNAIEAASEIAKLVRAEATKLGINLKKAGKEGDKAAEEDENAEDRSQIEGVSLGNAKKATQKKENAVTSLSDVIRKRQAEKRHAGTSS